MKKKKVFLSVCLSIALIMGLSVCSFCDTTTYYLTQIPEGTQYNLDSNNGGVDVDIINDTGDTIWWSGVDEISFWASEPTQIGTLVACNEQFGFFAYRGAHTLCIVCNPFYIPPQNSGVKSNTNTPTHVHNFTWQTIYDATPNSDGLEGEVCSCGAIRNTQPISAMDYAVNKYADQMIKAAKPGQKITLEFGEFNSFPRYMMEKIAARMNDNITFVFKFKQNKKMQTVTIEPGTAIDLQYDWYGPDKMKELYGAE